MIKVKIQFGEGFNTEWQDKSFKDEMSCIEWCRRNYAKIFCINDYRTFYEPIPHFAIMDAINGKSN